MASDDFLDPARNRLRVGIGGAALCESAAETVDEQIVSANDPVTRGPDAILVLILERAKLQALAEAADFLPSIAADRCAEDLQAVEVGRRIAFVIAGAPACKAQHLLIGSVSSGNLCVPTGAIGCRHDEPDLRIVEVG